MYFIKKEVEVMFTYLAYKDLKEEEIEDELDLLVIILLLLSFLMLDLFFLPVTVIFLIVKLFESIKEKVK